MLRARLKQRCLAHRRNDLWRQQHCLQHPTQLVSKKSGQAYINFCSNDYLGLAQHAELQSVVAAALQRYGVGSGASQLVCGHTVAHRQAQSAFAERFGFSQALMFANGFMANLAVIQTFLSRHDVVVQDKENHASLIDAALSTRATLMRYRHVDAAHAGKQLQAALPKATLLASDAVFSMSGDEAPIAALSSAAHVAQSLFVIDDAHGVGVLGDGYGSLRAQVLSADAVDILVLPLGKAFGVYGCMVLADDDIIDALRQFARPYIYTTATPAAWAVAATHSLELMFAQNWRVAQLTDRIDYFRQQALLRSLDFLPSRTAIQSLVLGESTYCLRLVEVLNAQGFLLTAIRPPTVAYGAARLRVTLNMAHTDAQITGLLDAILAAQRELS